MNDFPSQPAERLCATSGCFGAAMPCRASCCLGSRWYCAGHAHHAQHFLDTKNAPLGHFGAQHPEVLKLVAAALAQKPPERISQGPLNVGHLFDGLNRFGPSYSVLRVFADDLSDSADVELAQVAFGDEHQVAVYASGVVHLARPGVTFAPAPMSSITTAVKACFEIKTPTFRSRVLGLLMAPDHNTHNLSRIFAMEFDGETWRAYDGPLLSAMKKLLLEPRASRP